MSCHGTGKPEVQVKDGTQVVILLDGQAYDLASFERAPKISVQHSESSSPRASTRAAVATDSRKLDAQFNCLACHDPHASKAGHLLRKSSKGQGAAGALPIGEPGSLRGSTGVTRDVTTHQDSFSGGGL